MSFSRREFLLGAGGLLAAGLAGCNVQEGAPVVADLPDAERLPVPAPMIPAGPPSAPPPTVHQVPAFGANSFGIYPRSAWTRYGVVSSQIQPMNGVTRITFHHSGDVHDGRNVPFLADGFAETIQHLELVREYHVRQRGWADIGYHFAIDRMGRVFQLRSLRYQGAHVKGQDEHNLGIVVLGNFDVQAPTAAQKERMVSFGKICKAQYAVGSSQVWIHRELGITRCPGTTMTAYMNDVRRRQHLL
ncbi:MAG TPA: peptidoglycan recognition family protein [Phycisphaerae bacterium]|nr:peptidoglycan recognition family protein [Phycisphaerae bacterium]